MILKINRITPCWNTIQKESWLTLVKPAGRHSWATSKVIHLFYSWPHINITVPYWLSSSSLSPILPLPWVICSNKCILSQEAFIHVAQQQLVAFSVFSFLLSKSPPLSFVSNPIHDSSVNRVHTILLVFYIDLLLKCISISVKTHVIIHLLFTWGILCIFWVLVRRGVVSFGASAWVEVLEPVTVWNLFLSTLPA